MLLLPWPLHAASLEDAAHELAMKVCATARKQQVRVHWLEPPESPGYFSDARKKIFLDQVAACGIDPVDSPDVPALTVAIRITASKVLLIADATDASVIQQTCMIEVPRAALEVPRETFPAPQMQKELLWQQEKPIQSAMEWRDPVTQERYLFLLSENQLMRSHFETGTWKLVDSTELPSAKRRSRSGEGTFIFSGARGKLEVLLDHKECEFDPIGRVSFACSVSYIGGKALRLSSNCEESGRTLSTGKGDYTQPDRIVFLKAAARGPASSPEEDYSSSVDMPGPVLDISELENSKAVFAVIRNLSTGNYEVYRVTAACSN